MLFWMVGDRSTSSVLSWALGIAMAALVFCFVLGSSSVPRLTSFGHSARWGMLLIVWCVAAAAAWSTRRDVVRLDVPVHTVASLGLAALAVVSAAWSVAAHTTIGRGGTLCVLASAAVLLAAATTVRPAFVPWVLGGVLAGSFAAGLVGALLLVFDRHAAVQAASQMVAARYRGLGENPNTYSMLAATTTPLAAWAILDGRARWHRFAGGLAGIVVVLSIAFSASRGAFLAAFFGSLVFASARPDARRFVTVPATCAVFAIAFILALVPKPEGISAAAGTTTTPTTPTTTQASIGNNGKHANRNGAHLASAPQYNPQRLEDEEYRPLSGVNVVQTHPILGASGRAQAWAGAIEQANERPLLGYGFGTEDRVFIDRFYGFQGARPENSWIGMYLQLGVAGLLALAAFWLSLVPAVWRGIRSGASGHVAALVGVCAAGLALTVPQSYLYSVGNVATATVWVAAAMLAYSLATRSGRALAE
jgi:hypothetical protein